MRLVINQSVITFWHEGFEMVIPPPQAHFNLHVLVNAGLPAMFVFLAPGDHAEVVTGIHGAGVLVPNAAAVAAMTIGFCID